MASLYAQGRKSAPFKPAGTVFQSKEVDFAGLGPQTEPEPSIVKDQEQDRGNLWQSRTTRSNRNLIIKAMTAQSAKPIRKPRRSPLLNPMSMANFSTRASRCVCACITPA